MISSAAPTLPMSYHNRTETADTSTLLLAWLEEDLEGLQTQRRDLETRIARAEHRIAMLRDTSAIQATHAPAANSGFANSAAASNEFRNAESLNSAPVPVAQNDVAPPAPTYEGPRRSIISLGLETRTHNALLKAGVTSFAQLVNLSAADLRALPGFGAGCLTDLEAALARVNMALPNVSQRITTSTADATRTHAQTAQPSAAIIASQHTTDNENTVAAAMIDSSNSATEHSDTAPSHNSTAQYDDAIALHYRFGALRLEDIRDTLGTTDIAALELLKSDARFTAHNGGWYLRTPVEQSWIARRIIEILNAVRTVAIEPLYQAIKRNAAVKFLEHGCHMPSRSLLGIIVQELRTEGVRFDIVREIASIDAPITDRELSGATQAILKAFNTHNRALSSAELIPHFVEMGLTEASAHVALSTSPLVHRLERGIYGLVGRNADMRDIGQARLRREAGKLVEATDA